MYVYGFYECLCTRMNMHACMYGMRMLTDRQCGSIRVIEFKTGKKNLDK